MDFTKDIRFDCNPTTNQDVIITYHGFLSNSENLTIVYGFSENWENTTETNMSKTQDGFVAKIKMLNFDTFNFCFRNSNYKWDNNSNCNYISSILPAVCKEEKVAPKFDIDGLIEEILQPLVLTDSIEQIQENTPFQISSKPIDLGEEIGNILSQIKDTSSTETLKEYSTLEEILSCEIISQQPIEALEKEKSSLSKEDYAFALYINEYFKKIFDKIDAEFAKETEENEFPITSNVETLENSLVPLEENHFIVSPRKLGKFYSFRKRIKLAFYKALVKIPKMIFGTEKDTNF